MKIAKTRSRQLHKNQTSTVLVDAIIKGIQGKKGENVVCLNLKNVDNAVCDYFVICHGNSNTHVASIANSIEEEVLKENSEKPWHVEGTENAEWILMDYVNVVVHIFQKSTREFYKLEDLWADAEIYEVKIAI